jgi:hypothetical protein
MNETEFGFKIKTVLDSGLNLGPAQTARLRAARERALSAERQLDASAELVTAGASSVRFRAGSLLTRVALPAAILIAGVLGWQHWRQEAAPDGEGAYQELGALDADLLKSDIPIDALLDRDFHAYLKKVSQRE